MIVNASSKIRNVCSQTLEYSVNLLRRCNILPCIPPSAWLIDNVMKLLGDSCIEFGNRGTSNFCPKYSLKITILLMQKVKIKWTEIIPPNLNKIVLFLGQACKLMVGN